MKHSRPLTFVTSLIIYGSLYPFNFSPARSGALTQLFFNPAWFTSTIDMLCNVALFMPLGLIAMLAGATHRGRHRTLAVALVLGFLLALGLQVLQIFLPSRDATLADVLWNMLGMVLGLLAGALVIKRGPEWTALPAGQTLPLALLVGLVAIEWFPLVPHPDLQWIKGNLRSLNSTPLTLSDPLWRGMAVALLAGYLLAGMRLRRSTGLLFLLLSGICIGKLFMGIMPLEPSTPVGLALGGIVWCLIQQGSEKQRRTLVWLTLILCYTASALYPYQLRNEAAAISWVPFAGMLEGSLLENIRTLAGTLIFYVGILYVGAMAAGKLESATWALALWVLVVELMQSHIPTRSADLTQPLLVWLVGQTLATWERVRPVRVTEVVPIAWPDQPKPLGNPKQWLLQAGLAVSMLILGFSALLSLPGIPYNARELLRANASLPALFAFSMALLWAGGGSVWLGKRLTRARRPARSLLPLTLAVCGVSFSLLWAGVTTESLEDISGSANRFWFVTQREVWGPAWKEAFIWIDSPQLIALVERFVRYSALYAPLPLILAVLMVARQSPWQGRARTRKLMGLMVCTGALLWACKSIAFDWSSTDNLNELIARDGDWGWGGGGFLYALLLIVCINTLLLTEAVQGGALGIGLALMLTLVVLPVGWWLLNQGLEQRVQKYGLVYSGVQFLLGADRQHLLSPYLLFVRWCAVQAGTTVILATGVWLGQSASGLSVPPVRTWRPTPSTRENVTS